MKEKRPWRLLWLAFLVLSLGSLEVPVVFCQDYDDPAKGDTENPVAALGFSGVVSRHDGYVKGETPTIPKTSFACSNQPHNPGLYADMETQCQVYHVCFEDRQESFLCGPGTNFNQRILACDFWYNFNCQDSATFYSVNADIGKVPDTVHHTADHQPRQPQPRPQPQPQRPSYPSFPQQPDSRTESSSHQPPRVGRPPPPPPPRPQPQPPRFQPPPPSIHTQPPRFQPEPLPPVFQPQPPRIQPPAPPPRIQPPSFQPPPPPPRIYPEPPPFKPEFPAPPPQSQYPRIPQGSGQPGDVRPLPPSFQQEDDTGYHFDNGYKPQKPIALPPPQPTHPLTPRPVFPPVVSPPRVSRPPLTPPVFRQPSGSSHRPRVPVSRPNIPEYDHPDANIKGSTEYRPPPPPPQQPRVPQPSRPVITEYPSYPVVSRPAPRPVSRPPPPPPQPPIQQEHIDTEYVPPPPPPKKPAKPSFVVPPPPPPPVSRPSYVPPPQPQEPIEPEYIRPQPPVSPSIIREQQKPAVRPPSRPQVTVSQRPPQPQRPRPVFPPASDHPNSNIKGGPGYQPPPPPRFEPTRISRPSTSQAGILSPPEQPKPKPVTSSGGYQPPISVKQVTVKEPSHSGSTGYKPPPQVRIKKPSEPAGSVYQPPITPIIDHPRSEIKGSDYQPPVQRVQSPSTSTGVKRPQRPRAPVVVSRNQPPIKKPIEPIYEKPEEPRIPVTRVKSPSQTTSTVLGHTSGRQQPRFPTGQHIDHPNANVKGGPGYSQRVRVPQASRPSGPPSSPSTSYEQKTQQPVQPCQAPGRRCGSQESYPPRGDDEYYQHEVRQQQAFKPQRRPQQNTIQSTHKVPQGSIAVEEVYVRPPSSSHHVGFVKTPEPEYDGGSSYKRGPDTYPKPEFGQSNAPYQPPVSTPSRSTHKERPSSQNSIVSIAENKPGYRGSPATSGTGTQVRPEYPFREVPGHQPPNQRQVFPHRENPDHPNESLKGSGAYRPPPPAGFQGAASEVQQQQVVPEPEPEPAAQSPLLGDIGAE